MKAGLKTAFRLFKKHFARFTTIIAIVAVSIGFMSGIGEVENKIKIGARDLYEQSRVTDLYIKSSSPSGFTPQEIVTVCQRFGEENVKTGFCYETAKGENALRVYWLNVEDSLGKIELLEGELPTQEGEILAERETEGLTSCAVGDTVYIYVGEKYQSIMFKCEVVGADLYGNRSTEDLPYYKDLKKEPDIRYMKLKLVEKYSVGQYPLKELKENGLTSVQGRSKATVQLMKYLDK